MNDHQERCNCDECRKLDRMPLQGIPGTYQIRLIGDVHQDAAPPQSAAMPEALARLLAPSAEALPLFVGSLDPTLF